MATSESELFGGGRGGPSHTTPRPLTADLIQDHPVWYLYHIYVYAFVAPVGDSDSATTVVKVIAWRGVFSGRESEEGIPSPSQPTEGGGAGEAS